MSSTHVHTDMDVHYQTASKVMCTHALCVAFFFFSRNVERFFGQNVANSCNMWKRPHRKTV